MRKSGKLKNWLLYGIPIAIAGFLPMKSQAQERLIVDNFSQPNSKTLNYYGSGDVFLDNQINQKDVLRLDSLINKTLAEPYDDRLTDRADINGDGIINQTDKQILEDKLNGLKDYLSHWNKLTKTEKISWFEKMAEIDKTDTLHTTICYKFSTVFAINFHGFPSLENRISPDFPWQFSKNCRFNIPVYTVSTTTYLGNPHEINGVLVGANPLNFFDWYFINNSGQKTIPGDPAMTKGKDVIINYIKNMNPETGELINPVIIIKWHLDENGLPSLIYNKPYIIKSNPNKDIIAPEINLSSPKNSVYNHLDINLEYLVKENQTFLDSCRYKLNDSPWQNIKCSVPYYDILAPLDSISGKIPLSAKEGENNLVFYASDIAKPETNKSVKNIKFTVDKTPPTTSDNALLTWQNSDFSITLIPSDALSGVASTKYCIGSANDCIPNIEYSSPVLISEEGKKYFRYFSTDKAGNQQSILTKEIKLDKTAPYITASINQNQAGERDSAKVAINVSEANPDYAKYSYNGSGWTYFVSDTLFSVKLKEGENILNVEAKDKAGWNSAKKLSLIAPDAVEELPEQSNFKEYPNPASDFVKFEFYLNSPEKFNLSIYDFAGKELEKRLIKGEAGDNRIVYDFSKYTPAIYFYRFEGDKIKKSGKIIKY